MQIEIKHVRKDIRLFDDEGKICWDQMNQQTAFNKNYTLHQKKKKMKTGKSCKTIWRNSLPHNMYRTYLPLNTHMFNLCPMTHERVLLHSDYVYLDLQFVLP